MNGLLKCLEAKWKIWKWTYSWNAKSRDRWKLPKTSRNLQTSRRCFEAHRWIPGIHHCHEGPSWSPRQHPFGGGHLTRCLSHGEALYENNMFEFCSNNLVFVNEWICRVICISNNYNCPYISFCFLVSTVHLLSLKTWLYVLGEAESCKPHLLHWIAGRDRRLQ